jgi:uncharacterized protein (DUF58 family)
MTSRIRLSSILWPLLTLGAMVLQILDPSKVWRAMLVAFGGAWLVGWLWVWSLKRNLHLTREVRFTWAQVGDVLEEHFTLTNDGPIPATWLEMIDHSTLPDYAATRAVGVEGNDTNTWHTRGVCTRRGVYVLGGATLRSGDPLGVYSVEMHHPETTTLVVMPPVIPLPSIEIAPGGWVGDGRSRPHTDEQTVNASSVREYVHGDSLKMVHWHTTARRGKFYTRVMDGALASDWWIALDAEAAAQAGSGWESTLELGVILAASLADRGLRARHSVGLLASGESVTHEPQSIWIKPQSGEHHRLEIMRSLALIEAGSLSLAHLLERASPALNTRTSLIIITASTKRDWLSPLTRLRWKGVSPTVLLMDPSSFGARQNMDYLSAALANMGVPRFVLTRDLLLKSEINPNNRDQWDWHISPTGKAISRRSPSDMEWRRLG